MLGNSLTTANDLPKLLSEGMCAEVVVHARGGARLAEHLNPKTRNGARTLAALGAVPADVRSVRPGPWDFVVLQEMSNAPVTTPDAYRRTVVSLARVVRDAGAVPVLYGTWAYREGSARLARLGLSYGEMHARMAETFALASSESAALLANACDAFFETDDPTLLYARDGVHPSEVGTRLVARILVETMGA
ncbi:MAG: SGNH/GDSL hydrolase family protein [Olsenella sp.]|nr:SGNH/GDSL hydrolase family protein [Olsenella sp.]